MESEGAVERTLGRQTVRSQWGDPDSSRENPRVQLSDWIGEISKRKKRYCGAPRPCSQLEQQARPSPRRDWCETRQAQGQVFVDRAEPEMGDGPPSRSRL